MIREKSHRLPKELYTGYRAVAFTARVQDRRCPFVTGEIFTAMESMLIEAASMYRADLPAYVFMPDHAHFVLSANDSEGDVLSAAKRFKQRSSYWLVRNHPGARWQKDFYDHILRRTEELEKQIRYILNNPVRAGLVGQWQAYPYRGSSVYDLNRWTTH